MTINYEKLVKDIIVPIVLVPENVLINVDEQGSTVSINLYVDETDLGRVIGKGGKTIQAVRTLLYSISARDNQKVILEVSKK